MNGKKVRIRKVVVASMKLLSKCALTGTEESRKHSFRRTGDYPSRLPRLNIQGKKK
jgi:hypothetical protein